MGMIQWVPAITILLGVSDTRLWFKEKMVNLDLVFCKFFCKYHVIF